MRFGSAEMIMAGGAKPLPAEEAFGTVRSVLCEGAKSSRNVYAVIVRGKLHSSKNPDYLSMMNSVISATKRGWSELWSLSEKNRVTSKSRRSPLIEVVERNGIRIYRGFTNPEEFKRMVVPAEGVYIFPSHWHQATVRNLGLEPLPRQFQTSPLVILVEDLESFAASAMGAHKTIAAPTSEEQKLDKDSLEWRRNFVSRYECQGAEAVADESGNTAKNRSAIASRWTTEKKIFSLRFENKTLYPKFQFKDGNPIPVVAKVLELFPDHYTGWDKAFFFTSSNSYLDDRKPVDMLRTDPERVVSVVHAFVQPTDVF